MECHNILSPCPALRCGTKEEGYRRHQSTDYDSSCWRQEAKHSGSRMNLENSWRHQTDARGEADCSTADRFFRKKSCWRYRHSSFRSRQTDTRAFCFQSLKVSNSNEERQRETKAGLRRETEAGRPTLLLGPWTAKRAHEWWIFNFNLEDHALKKRHIRADICTNIYVLNFA